MKQSSDHPTRAAMMRALKTGRIPFQDHLDRCRHCRQLFDLLRHFPVAGESPARGSGDEAVAGYALIPLLFSRDTDRQRRRGAVAFDSWSGMPAFQLRDIGPGSVRRLCLRAGKTSLEIIAERLREQWEFTARIYQSGQVATRWVLRVGGRKLLPKSLGFYHWSSVRVPRSIRLLSRSEVIDFERLSWE